MSEQLQKIIDFAKQVSNVGGDVALDELIEFIESLEPKHDVSLEKFEIDERVLEQFRKGF